MESERPLVGLLFVLVLLVLIVVTSVSVLRGRFAPVGAVARISVDDLAIGRAPDVCAVTGVPTTHRVEVSSSDGGFSAWWLLLLFLGPVGWVGLALLVALARRPGKVAGVLPISAEATARYNALVRLSNRATAAVLAAIMVGGVALVLVQRTWSGSSTVVFVAVLAVVVTAVVVSLATAIVAPYRWIDLELDGSGRWVTVRRAHPMFAETLRSQYAARVDA